jgi:hypothetical protein
VIFYSIKENKQLTHPQRHGTYVGCFLFLLATLRKNRNPGPATVMVFFFSIPHKEKERKKERK